MGIGASEHRTSVRAKARFAGQKAREHILSGEMLLHRTYCHVSLVAFFGGKCRACLALPEVPASDLPALIHSRWLLPDPPRHSPLPGVSLFRCFRCYLDRPPDPHGPLRHPSLPGVSLFWRFRCHLDLPPIPHGSLRHPPLPGVSRFRRIGSHLRRVTQAPGKALWRRPPAPEAPPIRTSPLCFIAKPFPEPSPNHGPVTSWPGLPPRIPSGSVKGAPSRGRSGRGRCDRRGLAGWVGHEHTA